MGTGEHTGQSLCSASYETRLWTKALGSTGCMGTNHYICALWHGDSA